PEPGHQLHARLGVLGEPVAIAAVHRLDSAGEVGGHGASLAHQGHRRATRSPRPRRAPTAAARGPDPARIDRRAAARYGRRPRNAVKLEVVAIPAYFATMGAERAYLKRKAARQGPTPGTYERKDTLTS